MRRRNTLAFTFLSWASFAIALALMIIGIYNAGWPLMEKGYYIACTFFLVMASFVLQKTIRDNQEDEYLFPRQSRDEKSREE